MRKRVTSLRQLAPLIGMSIPGPAVLQAPLHYHTLQRLCNKSLRSNRYNCQVEMDLESKQDLHVLLWIHHLPLLNGRSLTTPVVITLDASTVGWGATCQDEHVGDPWSKEERKAHINFLELKAAFLALKTLVSNNI